MAKYNMTREQIDQEAYNFVGDNKHLFFNTGYVPTMEEFYLAVENLVAMTLHYLECKAQRIR